MDVPALRHRPKLTQWTLEYWEAFQVLSSSRLVHQGGIGPIPLSEMVSYMDTVNLVDVDERLKLIKMIQALDKVYVKHINSKAKRESELKRGSMPKRPRRKGRR